MTSGRTGQLPTVIRVGSEPWPWRHGRASGRSAGVRLGAPGVRPNSDLRRHLSQRRRGASGSGSELHCCGPVRYASGRRCVLLVGFGGPIAGHASVLSGHRRRVARLGFVLVLLHTCLARPVAFWVRAPARRPRSCVPRRRSVRARRSLHRASHRPGASPSLPALATSMPMLTCSLHVLANGTVTAGRNPPWPSS